MFVSFLMPHVDRGAGPLFHLIMLLQMSRFAPDEICFIGDDAYFDEQHVPFGEEMALGTICFSCVSEERFRAYRKVALPFDAVAGLYEDGRSHLDAFQALLTRDHPPLGAAIAAALDGMAVAHDTIEAFLTWSNCPSLTALAARLKAPVIHNELGPFRGPDYQDTVFFDFQGVNGNTTPATRWTDPGMLATELEGMPCLTTAALRALLVRGAASADADADTDTDGEPPVRYPLGVALQVEDDSNTVAYGNGIDTIRLLYRALRDLPPERVLVRSHPGARLGYRGGLGVPDDSPTSLAFLGRIDHLLTINSSVAAEAALWGVPYTVLGDTPFAILSRPLDAAAETAPAAQTELALNALFVGYLVPAALLYDPDYYRWRLGGARLRNCFARHLQVLKRQAMHTETPPPDLAAPANPAPSDDTGSMPYRNAALWSATRSVTRGVEKLTAQVAELETQLAAAIAERNKNWEERCWFQTNLQRVEQEIDSLRSERDTLRFAVAAAQHASELALKDRAAAAVAEAFDARSQALMTRHAETEQALQAMHQRFEDLNAQLADVRRRYGTAEAQNKVLTEELNRTMRERIEALKRGLGRGRSSGDGSSS